jgi:hypothetical protein
MNPDRARCRAWVVALALIAGLGAGCTSFHRHWRAASAVPPAPDGIEGAWQGRWLSHSNGHNGTLRAIIRRTSSGDYETRFRATFAKVFEAGYTITLNAEPQAGGYRLSGTNHVGRWLFWDFGDYVYRGTASATNFSCTFEAGHDHGVFQMTRPE